MLNPSARRQLDELGYLVLPDFMPRSLLDAHMWHGGTANRTDRCRRALHGFHTRSDKPQQQYQKSMLRPETVASLSPLQRKVLAIDDAENDRLSSRATRMSGFLKD